MSKETSLKKIYIAGPYTKGDVALNIKNAIMIGDILACRGFLPFVPHLTHFWHMMYHHDIDFWYSYDNEWLKICDGLLRIPGESIGSDKEVELAKKLGIPVFSSIAELNQYFNME